MKFRSVSVHFSSISVVPSSPVQLNFSSIKFQFQISSIFSSGFVFIFNSSVHSSEVQFTFSFRPVQVQSSSVRLSSGRSFQPYFSSVQLSPFSSDKFQFSIPSSVNSSIQLFSSSSLVQFKSAA